MEKLERFSLDLLFSLMALLDTMMVLFLASLYLLASRYALEHGLARALLEDLGRLSLPPLLRFGGALFFLAGLLICLIYAKRRALDNTSLWLELVETVFCLGLQFCLDMSCNGILLLVFCQLLGSERQPGRTGLLVSLALLYLFCDYHIFSLFFSVPNPQAYYDILPMTARSVCLMMRTLFATGSILLFIGYLIGYVSRQIHKKEMALQELAMVSQVNQELKNYAQITEKMGEDKERKRLARELHDTIGHALTGVAAGVDASIAMFDIDPELARSQLFLVSDVVRQGIVDVRGSLKKLRPGALEKNTFQEALEKLIDEFCKTSHIQVQFDYAIGHIDLENTKEDILYRMVQESLTNSVRHGHASQVAIHLYEEEDILHLYVQDNGSGCSGITEGFGLKQMKERVRMLGGEAFFDGTNGFLTLIRILLQKGENTSYGESTDRG